MYQPLLTQRTEQLCAHPLFKEVTSINKLKKFMESHVFAVWDFMTLLKRLQQDLTCTRLPWLPPADPVAARLINAIVLTEESDQHPQEGYCSHFELYLEAMKEVGASTASIGRFIRLQRQSLATNTALHRAQAPRGAARFVSDTLKTALNAPTHCVAAVFLHSRERVIPAMFEQLLQAGTLIREHAPTLCAYLNRHIELDAQDHGPAAQCLLERLTGAHPTYPQQAHDAALAAMQSRITLWDEVRASLLEVQP